MSNLEHLNDNVTLVTEYMPQVMSTAIGIWTRTGAVNEDQKLAGISHFIEHMMFKGTNKRTAKQIAEDVDRIGGQINAFTGKEATCYYIKTLESNMDQGMEILFNMFTDSIFDSVEMEREKKVIYEEMKMVTDTPDENAHDTVCELVFKDNPLGNSIIGTQDTLKDMTRDTLIEYIDKQYTRDSIVVAVVGNFDINKVKEMINSKLSYLKASKKEAEVGSEVYKPRYCVKTKDIEQTHICLATRSLSRDDDRYYDLSVLNSIMGGTMSSRFFQNIRERKGLAYSVYSSNNAFKHKGYFNIYAAVSSDKVGEAIDAIKNELKGLGEKGVTNEEVQKAKEQIKSSYIFGQENVSGRMFSIGKQAILYGNLEDQKEVLEKIDRVNVESLREMITLISDIRGYSGAIVGSKDVDLESMLMS